MWIIFRYFRFIIRLNSTLNFFSLASLFDNTFIATNLAVPLSSSFFQTNDYITEIVFDDTIKTQSQSHIQTNTDQAA